jgi:hypothetical protein
LVLIKDGNLIKFDVYIKNCGRPGGGSISFCYTSRYTLAVQSTSVAMFVSVSQQQCDRQLDSLMPHRPFATTVSQLKTCRFSGETFLKVLKCYNFLWVQRRHNCSPAASFANSVMTLYLLKVNLKTFLSIPITQKMPNFELWHSCPKWAIYELVN